MLAHVKPGLARLGRTLLAILFIVSGFQKIADFQGSLEYMDAAGVPPEPIILGVGMLMELVGGILLLIGFRERFAALLLVAYLIPVTLLVHDFWAFEGAEGMMQRAQFLKNVAILGGLLAVAAEVPVPAGIETPTPAAREEAPVP